MWTFDARWLAHLRNNFNGAGAHLLTPHETRSLMFEFEQTLPHHFEDRCPLFHTLQTRERARMAMINLLTQKGQDGWVKMVEKYGHKVGPLGQHRPFWVIRAQDHNILI